MGRSVVFLPSEYRPCAHVSWPATGLRREDVIQSEPWACWNVGCRQMSKDRHKECSAVPCAAAQIGDSVAQLVVLVDGERAVRRTFFKVLVRLVLDVLYLGLGADGRVDLLPRDAGFPSKAVRFRHVYRQPVTRRGGEGRTASTDEAGSPHRRPGAA